MEIINIGFGSVVSAERIVALLSPDSAPVRRRIQTEKEKGVLIDATYGRKIRSVLILDTNQVVVSAISPETIQTRMRGKDLGADANLADEEEETEDV